MSPEKPQIPPQENLKSSWDRICEIINGLQDLTAVEKVMARNHLQSKQNSPYGELIIALNAKVAEIRAGRTATSNTTASLRVQTADITLQATAIDPVSINLAELGMEDENECGRATVAPETIKK